MLAFWLLELCSLHFSVLGPSCIFITNSVASSDLSLSLLPSSHYFLSQKNPYEQIEPTWKIRESSHLKIPNLITSANPFCHVMQQSQVPVIKMWTSILTSTGREGWGVVPFNLLHHLMFAICYFYKTPRIHRPVLLECFVKHTRGGIFILQQQGVRAGRGAVLQARVSLSGF